MSKYKNPYSALKGIFHEPNRLAIISALSSAPDGLTFREIKEQCVLTDGNLSRHLKVLEEAEVVEIKKQFIGAKPQTKAYLTDYGRESFIDYLKVLEDVLQKAADAVASNNPDFQLNLARIKPA
jgi:DNA-binding transcriptional ArsR family regulator